MKLNPDTFPDSYKKRKEPKALSILRPFELQRLDKVVFAPRVGKGWVYAWLRSVRKVLVFVGIIGGPTSLILRSVAHSYAVCANI